MNAHAGKWIPWIWGLLAVALLGGCSKDESLKSEPGSVPGPDRIEIRLSGGIALSDAGSKALASLPVTRAVVDANHEADLRVSFARIDQNGGGRAVGRLTRRLPCLARLAKGMRPA